MKTKELHATGLAGLLLAVMFAGCTGGAPAQDGDAPTASGTLDASLAPAPPAQADEGTGAVEGRVANENGAGIPKAFVLLIGSRNSTTADRDGRFSMSYVVPGEYTLRVDAQNYRSLESTIKVVSGQVTRANVTLVPLVDRGAGFREHLHDAWGEATTKVLFEGSVNYDYSVASGGRFATNFCLYNPTTGMPSTYSGSCPSTVPVFLPDGIIVYPGTAKIHVKVSWTSPYVTGMGFRFSAANETKVLRPPIMLKSGESSSFAVEFPMTDHGHQTFTMWTFELVPDMTFAGYRVLSQGDFNRRFVGPFEVSLIAEKGTVPAEQPHATFWTNSSEIVLADKLERKLSAPPSASTPKNPADTTCTGTAAPCFVLPAGVLVPPGTTRLRVTLEVVNAAPGGASVFGDKVLTFRTAKVNPRFATYADLRVEPGEGNAAKRTWELKLAPAEADAFYQKKSLWAFILANQGREREDRFLYECFTFVGAGCESVFRLTAVAINDDFVPPART